MKTVVNFFFKPTLTLIAAALFFISCGLGTGKAPDDLKAGSDLISFTKNSLCGFINTEGKVVIKPKYESTSFVFSEGLAAVRINGRWGFINPKGEWVVKPKYKSVTDFNDGLARVAEDSLCGYIDRTGQYVIEPRFEKADAFSDGMAGVVLNGQYGYIDKSGEMVFHTEMNFSPFSEGRTVGIDPLFHHINKKGMPVSENRFDQIWTDFNEGMSTIQWGGQTWYVDTNDRLLFGHGFEYATRFNEGLAVVLNAAPEGQAAYYAIINKRGEEVCRVQGNPDHVCSFSCGLASARFGDKIGYIDRDGKIAIEPKYTGAYNFYDNGIAVVELDGRRIYINTKGETIWEQK